MDQNIAYFRFYEELNDFLPQEKQKKEFIYRFNGSPSIKDVIEAIGIPHTEVDLILANSNPVNFGYNLEAGDRISVYPVFESLDISPISHLRPEPLRVIKFILDTHIGKLCKYLRIFGFDSLYGRDYEDLDIINTAHAEKRIILTRDKGLLKNKKVDHGYWLRSQIPEEQLKEVVLRFSLINLIRSFTRCLVCNGNLIEVNKNEVDDFLLPDTRKYYFKFVKCAVCGKVFWKGSHFERMKKFIDEFINEIDE